MAARIAVWLFFLCASLVMVPFSPAPAVAAERFEKSALTIETADGPHLRFQVELATTPAQQEQGLMFRQKLATDAGMLFVYANPQPASFWMKNTYLPLDMLFIGPDGRIEKIAANATPLSTTPIDGLAVTKAVLEINGGIAARLGIRVGDTVVHPLLGTTP